MPLVLSGTNGISNNGTNWGIQVDSSGRITQPNKPHLSGTVGCTASNGVANIFSTYTSGGGMSWGGDRITVQFPGVYLLTWQTITVENSVRIDTYLSVNGTYITSGLNDAATGYHQRTHVIAYRLNANDFVQFYSTNWYNRGDNGGVWSTVSVTLL